MKTLPDAPPNKLSPAHRARLLAMLRMSGEVALADRLCVGRNTLLRAAAGLPQRRSTVGYLAAALGDQLEDSAA